MSAWTASANGRAPGSAGARPFGRRPFDQADRLAAVLRRLAVAADPGIGPVRGQLLALRDVVRPGIARDHAIGLPHHIELAVFLDLADQHGLAQVMVGVHDRDAAGQVLDLLADHRLAGGIDVGGAGLLDRLHPHVEADVVRLHRIVGDPAVVLDEVVPVVDECRVLGRVDRHEVVPGGEMADQVRGVDARELLLADPERDHWQVDGVDALVREFLVEGHIGSCPAR